MARGGGGAPIYIVFYTVNLLCIYRHETEGGLIHGANLSESSSAVIVSASSFTPWTPIGHPSVNLRVNQGAAAGVCTPPLPGHSPPFHAHIYGCAQKAAASATTVVVHRTYYWHQTMQQCIMHHPGVIAATEWGKRYGKNLIPQSYSTPGHTWQHAKDINWGAWSCCGGAASSAPCQNSTLMASEACAPGTVRTGVHESDIVRGVGAQIQFLIEDKLLTTVVDEDEKTWKLDSGRVAKKKTEGKSWVWACDVKP